jgi:endosialidase-like protein
MKFDKVCCAAITTLVALGLPLRPVAQVAGGGTTNFVPRWTNSTSLGNSNISDAGGVVAIIGKNGTINTNGGNAPIALKVTGGSGAENLTGFGVQGSGGLIQLVSGNGAPLPGTLGLGGTGGVIQVVGGSGATCIPAAVRCASYNGGNGGSITVQPGAGGRGLTKSGQAGNILLAPTGGNVGIGLSNPAHTLEVKIGGTTLADAWVTRSTRRIKSNIKPLRGALEKIERLQGVSYERRDDGKREIGVVAEDVDKVVPEVVSHDPETREVQGVDYSRLAALLIEAVKSQQAEIALLRAQVEQLRSNGKRP